MYGSIRTTINELQINKQTHISVRLRRVSLCLSVDPDISRSIIQRDHQVQIPPNPLAVMVPGDINTGRIVVKNPH